MKAHCHDFSCHTHLESAMSPDTQFLIMWLVILAAVGVFTVIYYWAQDRLDRMDAIRRQGEERARRLGLDRWDDFNRP